MLDTMAIRGPKWFVIAALVTMAPDTPGVFELWEDDELVFVGSTRDSTLRHQLLHELLERTRASASCWRSSSSSITGRRDSTRAAEPLP
jgi:hypothetical protein